jgi:hypothetical protein
MKVGYGKIGRSMPLTLAKCGNLGGDVEQVAVVKALAERHPDDEFWLVGRNTGENPQEVGLPANVINPWTEWSPKLLELKRARGLNHGNLTIDDHLAVGRIFDELTADTLNGMDGFVLWAGQHGTTNMPLPGIRNPDTFTKPHDWCAHYCAFLLRAVNRWRDVNPWKREEVWLNSDPRNNLKMRDLKWPLRHPVLTQHTFDHRIKHERFGDPGSEGEWEEWSATYDVGLEYPEARSRVWQAHVRNVYARLEVNGLLPGTPFGDLITYNEDWVNREPFGLFINETRKYVRADVARVNVMREWVLPQNPAWIHGSWSEDSLTQLGRDIQPAPWDKYYPRLHSVRCTFTTPASGTGWATAKPWEAFAAGTVCFFHPGYDKQDNVLGDAPDWLRKWLRVESPQQLAERIEQLNQIPGQWLGVVRAQRAHFLRAITNPVYLQMIEERLWG